MSDQKRRQAAAIAHTDAMREDDGVDPRQFFRHRSNNKEDRKAKQLCRQVAQTLSLVLGDGGNEHDAEILHYLDVIAVLPAPDSSRLLVQVCTVGAPHEGDKPTSQEVLRTLHAHSGRLRSEIATSIHRKRVPTLVFELVAIPGGEV